MHTFQQKSDSGLEIDLLQKYIFVPLDIFRENVDNNGVKNKLDAWLTFLGIDEPEEMIDEKDRQLEEKEQEIEESKQCMKEMG